MSHSYSLHSVAVDVCVCVCVCVVSVCARTEPSLDYTRFEVNTASKIKIAASWFMKPCSLTDLYRWAKVTRNLTNQNSIPEEITNRLKSKNACYHSVQILLSTGLLSKNLKIKIYRTIILPVVFYGCETWSLTLREERRLRVFENMVLRRLFRPKKD